MRIKNEIAKGDGGGGGGGKYLYWIIGSPYPIQWHVKVCIFTALLIGWLRQIQIYVNYWATTLTNFQ